MFPGTAAFNAVSYASIGVLVGKGFCADRALKNDVDIVNLDSPWDQSPGQRQSCFFKTGCFSAAESLPEAYSNGRRGRDGLPATSAFSLMDNRRSYTMRSATLVLLPSASAPPASSIDGLKELDRPTILRSLVFHRD